VKRQILAVLGVFLGGTIMGPASISSPAAEPAAASKSLISAEARDAIARMGKTLQAQQFSFEAQTVRVYAGPNGEPLHIFHTLNVTVRRPDRLLVVRNGDDGPSKLVYDGKTLAIYIEAGNKYARIPVPGTLEGMMKEAMGRLGVDFPLADFLTNSPAQSFLSGVTQGEVVNTVTIGGVPCLHLFFVQPPGLDLELWTEKNAPSLPRRLIVTYRTLPGEPEFAATFSNWNFAIHPTDADFVFAPPPGAVQFAVKPALATPPAAQRAMPGGAK
jgi:hypothetical protein